MLFHACHPQQTKAYPVQVGRLTIGDLRKIEAEAGMQPSPMPAIDVEPAIEEPNVHEHPPAPTKPASNETLVATRIPESLPCEHIVPTVPVHRHMSKDFDDSLPSTVRAVIEAEVYGVAPQTPSKPIEPISRVQMSPEESTPCNTPVPKISKAKVCNLT